MQNLDVGRSFIGKKGPSPSRLVSQYDTLLREVKSGALGTVTALTKQR